MVADRFGTLLEELGSLLQIKLAPDENNACKIRYPDKLELTMALDPSTELLFIIIEIGVPPEGKYRENLFREALRANGSPGPSQGVFCYAKKTDMLLLFEQLTIADLHAPVLAELLQLLCEKAREWKQSISLGEIPTASISSSRPSSGIFGLQ